MTDLMEPIAIVGIAGRFPGAHDIEEFWANLRAGREGLRTLTDEELLAAGVPPESLRDPNYVKVNGDVPDMDMFDAPFFGMTPREATLCDPQLRLFLEIAHSAVESAGYDVTALTDVGVYAATGHSLYMDHNLRLALGVSAGDRDLLAGVFNYPDYVSTLVSYKLDFTGPSMTVLTACSSSLLTLHLAVQALHSGECSMAIAGGTEAEMIGHGYLWRSGGPLSRDGHCRSFDAGATGTVFASGVGAVVLKRLPDALADGDHIWAVVRGTAANNDGGDKVGFSAPGVSGQRAVVMEALGIAAAEPDSIGYVEAHGTGTALGDPIEFTALQEAFSRSADGRSLPPGFCGLGSVKSNVGHLGHAAGVASLIKTALCLERELIPSTLHVTEPNPKLEIEKSPFYLVTSATPWPRQPGRIRRAGVNSLGFGGTNVHAVLEEAPPREPVQTSQRPRLVVWSARTEAAARAYEAKLSAHLASGGEDAFRDTVTTLQRGRTAHPVRAAAVCDRAATAVEVLTGKAGRVVRGHRPGQCRWVAFLFPGQGSQHARMAAGLYGAEPAFTHAFDRCLDLLEKADCAVRHAWLAGTDEALEDTAVAQPLLFALEYSLAQMWQAWGVKPDAVLGHSVGELVAATVAGVFTPADAARLVVVRARAMAAMPRGAMLAVAAPASQIAGRLPEGVSVAVINGPRQTVVGGAAEAVSAAADLLGADGIATRRLRTSHAFHTAMMAPACDAFADAVEGVTAAEPSIPVYSAASARLLTAQEAARPAFWADQLATPVLFGQALEALLADGEWSLLEAGPERALSTLASRHPGVSAGRHLVVSTLPRSGSKAEDDLPSVLTALGMLWAEGHQVNWSALAPDEPVRRLAIPGYQYERRRYWAEPSNVRTDHSAAAPALEPRDDGAPAEVAAPALATVGWRDLPIDRSEPRRGDFQGTPAVALLPAELESSLPLMLALQQAGLRVTPVRPGDGYHDGGTEYRARPDVAEDLARVLRGLADRGRPAGLLVHAWSAGEWAEATSETVSRQLDLSFRSLLNLIQQGHRAAGTGRAPGLLVLTSRSADISGGEPLDPVKTTLHGLVRTMAIEVPGQFCRLIDVGPGLGEDDLVTELWSGADTSVVALRRDRRWVRAERPWPLPRNGRPALRRDGVYLITGGLGGLGLEVAKGLARTGLRPRLALLGRTGRVAEADLSELAMYGASVRVLTADVADLRAMRRALDTVNARLGPVNGVLHLAGVAGDGVLLFRDPARAEEVLRPKVAGTLVLSELLSDRPPLDFFVTFASQAGLKGLLGSGDYAAANAFLDGFAQMSRLAGGRVVSIDWPAWTTVGMAARARTSRPASSGGTRSWETVLSATEYPFLDEHRVNGIPVLPGTGLLDLVVTAFSTEFPEQAERATLLRDVIIQQPLAVRHSQRVRVAFKAATKGWTFGLWSSPVEGADEILHMTGEVAGEIRPAPVIDLQLLRARLPEREPPERLRGRVFSFGPRWNNSTAVSFPPGGDRTEKLVSLSLPKPFLADLADHPLHPALLDTALSSTRDPERDDVFIPFMYRSAVIYRRLPAEFDSHITRRPATEGMIQADIRLIAPDGSVVAEFDGFTMRHTTRERLANVEQVAPAAREERHDEPGMEPETGVGILLDILNVPAPRQVVVRPFRDGQPVQPEPEPVPPSPRTLTERVAASPGADLGPQRPHAATAPAVAPAPTLAATGAGLEDRLRHIWASALGRPDIKDSDDFFDLGGNSLSAIDLMTRIREELGAELSIATLFDHPTLGALSAALRSQGVLHPEQ